MDFLENLHEDYLSGNIGIATYIANVLLGIFFLSENQMHNTQFKVHLPLFVDLTWSQNKQIKIHSTANINHTVLFGDVGNYGTSSEIDAGNNNMLLTMSKNDK